MSTHVLLDNTALQQVATLLSDGPEPGDAPVLRIDRDGDRHHVDRVPAAALQVRALFDLLTQVVTREQAVVDRRFAERWQDRPGPVHWLQAAGILDARSIPARSQHHRQVVERALDHLCVTSTLRRAQDANEAAFAERYRAEDPFLSSTVWGTAGMLGRAGTLGVPYSPAPVRQDLLAQTMFEPDGIDAVAEVSRWIDTSRARVFARLGPGVELRRAQLVAPPLPLHVIEEARTVEDLVPVAIQARDTFADLRRWLQTFQDALDDEDPRARERHQAALRDVAAANRLATPGTMGMTSVGVGVGIFSVSMRGPTLQGLRTRFGVRATLNELVLAPRGEASVRKLLGMLDLGGTALAERVVAALRAGPAASP